MKRIFLKSHHPELISPRTTSIVFESEKECLRVSDPRGKFISSLNGFKGDKINRLRAILKCAVSINWGRGGSYQVSIFTKKAVCLPQRQQPGAIFWSAYYLDVPTYK